MDFFPPSPFIKHKQGCWINVSTWGYLGAALLWSLFWSLTWPLFWWSRRTLTNPHVWYEPAACHTAGWSLLPSHSTDSWPDQSTGNRKLPLLIQPYSAAPLPYHIPLIWFSVIHPRPGVLCYHLSSLWKYISTSRMDSTGVEWLLGC